MSQEQCSGGYGYAATFLKGEGYRVKEVNAVLTDRQRARAPHPGKSDPIDGRAIAKVLIDQYGELPEAGSEEVVKALKELVQPRAVQGAILAGLLERRSRHATDPCWA